MKLEFPSYYKEIIDDALAKLNNELMLKLEVLRLAELEVEKKDSTANHVKTLVTVDLISGLQKQIFIEKHKEKMMKRSSTGIIDV
jgi:hypothetical protein